MFASWEFFQAQWATEFREAQAKITEELARLTQQNIAFHDFYHYILQQLCKKTTLDIDINLITEAPSVRDNKRFLKIQDAVEFRRKTSKSSPSLGVSSRNFVAHVLG